MGVLKIALDYPEETSKIILTIPNLNNRINATLRDTSSKIHAITVGLAYRDYLSVDNVLLLACDSILYNTIKSIKINNTININTEIASTFIIKNIDNIPVTDLILSALLITSIEKTISLINEMRLGVDLNALLSKSVGEIENQIVISSANLNPVSNKNISLSDFIKIKCSAENVVSKEISPTEVVVKILNEAKVSSEKSIGDIEGSIKIISSADYNVEYYRKLTDLKDLTFVDIKDWTLDNLIKIEK